MKKTIVTIWIFIATGCVFAQQKILPRDQAAVLFVGRSGSTLGYAQTLANYHKAYPNKAVMGELPFDILHLIQWDAQTIQLIGKFTLKRAEDSPSGSSPYCFERLMDNGRL